MAMTKISNMLFELAYFKCEFKRKCAIILKMIGSKWLEILY